MLFDPEDGMTLEQSIEIAWSKHVSPAMRARVLALAEQLGWTRPGPQYDCGPASAQRNRLGGPVCPSLPYPLARGA